MNLGTLLHNKRMTLSLTQEQIGNISGLAPARISKLERGITESYAYEIRLLSKAYQLPFDELQRAAELDGRMRR